MNDETPKTHVAATPRSSTLSSLSSPEPSRPLALKQPRNVLVGVASGFNLFWIIGCAFGVVRGLISLHGVRGLISTVGCLVWFGIAWNNRRTLNRKDGEQEPTRFFYISNIISILLFLVPVLFPLLVRPGWASAKPNLNLTSILFVLVMMFFMTAPFWLALLVVAKNRKLPNNLDKAAGIQVHSIGESQQNRKIITVVCAIVGVVIIAAGSLLWWQHPKDIFDAAWKGDAKAVSRFLVRGVDVNCLNNVKDTPLHLALTEDVAELLIVNGAMVNQPNIFGGTPLHMAAVNGRYEVAIILIKHGAEVNALDIVGATPLDHALTGREKKVGGGNHEAVIRLLQAGGGVARLHSNK